MGVTSDHCKGCVYQVSTGVWWTCDYLLITGHRRPCPPGAGCTVKQTTSEEADEMKKIQWDTDRAMGLFDAGMSDRQIADMLGTTKQAVTSWRQRTGIRRQPEQPPAEAPDPPPFSAPPEAPAPESLPEMPALSHFIAASGGNDRSSRLAATCPVELCVELEGGWARLRAPSWAQAVKLWKMLDTCIAALAREGGDG